MEQFLVKGSPGVDRKGHERLDKPKSLLFNPKPRQRKQYEHPRTSVSRGGSGYHFRSSASNSWKLRTSKLREQAPTAVSQFFAGLSFYFNGRTGDKQTVHLKSAVSKHGGRTTPVMSMGGVTHVIAENLSGVKTDKAMKSLKMKVVHPDWVKGCIAEGRLLAETPFRVVRGQKLGVGDFFRSSASGSTSLPGTSKAKNMVGSTGIEKQSLGRGLGLQSCTPGRSGTGHTSEPQKASRGNDKKGSNCDEVQRGDHARLAATTFKTPLPGNHVRDESGASAGDASSWEPTAARRKIASSPLVVARRKRSRDNFSGAPHPAPVGVMLEGENSNVVRDQGEVFAASRGLPKRATVCISP